MKKYIAPIIETTNVDTIRDIITVSSLDEGEGTAWRWVRPSSEDKLEM